MVSIQKMLSKPKEKTIGTYLKLVDSLTKPVILYACECWDDSMKKENFANKIEQFQYVNMQANTSCYQDFIRTRKNTA